MAKTCVFGECLEPAESGRSLCSMHRKRKQRKRPMDPPKCPPRTHQDRTIDRVEAAACELYALDSGPESDRAFESKRAQFRRFIRSLMSPSRPRVSA